MGAVMKLSQLNNLVAISEAGSVRQAARNLNLSQSAITRSIKMLEAELNAELLFRDSHGVSLTASGAALVKRARIVDAELRNARNDVELTERARFGDVKVSSSPTVAINLLPRAVLALKKSRPEVHVQIEEAVYPDNLASVHTGDVDIAVCLLPDGSQDQELDYQVLVEDSLTPAVRSDHPLTKELNLQLTDLVDHGWIVFGRRGSRFDIYEQTFRANGLNPPKSTIDTTSFTCALALVEKSDFIVLVPNQIFADRRRGWPISPLHMKTPMPPWTIAAIMRSRDRLSAVATELLLELKRAANNDP